MNMLTSLFIVSINTIGYFPQKYEHYKFLRLFDGFDFQYPFYRLDFGIIGNVAFSIFPLNWDFSFLKGQKTDSYF